MKVVALIVLASGIALAQTRVTTQQVVAPTTTQPQLIVAVPVAGGGSALRLVTLDSSVQLVASGGGFCTATSASCTLSVTPAAPAYTEVFDEVAVLTSGPQGTLTLKNSGTITALKITRNGILLRPTVDYSLSGNVVTFVAAQALQAGDVVGCDYRFR